ncbi:soluble NSF attachment family protein [Geomonas sp. RF6]|uniref:soluble NSF attachment family protein n=1 Tax=Geomonas sp. RF6 TaxID=2897342 RepID=UPI001E4437E6|nr:soluble NSF attachment family protein [Geomonas sp. RF6]UFS72273.1 soluble NSF attachment family protein [Geomonas sp. RF6]
MAKKLALNIALVAVVSIVLLWGNTLYRQHVQFDKGEKAYAAGDFVGAVAGYDAAIHMYTPGSSLVERAAQKLWEIAEVCERSGDVPRALVAYRSLRSAFYGVAGLYSPGTDWIAKCDARIAGLVQRQQGQR